MDLNYVRTGEGDPLVLLHQLGGSTLVWEPVIERLAAERDVIALDMPGFGDSPPLPDGTAAEPQALAGAVAAFLGSRGITRPHTAGLSLGSWVALELAKEGRALSVTGLCPAGFWKKPLGPRRGIKPRTVAKVVLPVMPLVAWTRFGRRLATGGAAARPERIPSTDALRLMRDYSRGTGFDGAERAMRSALFSGMDRISVPVTLAWGEHDDFVTEPTEPVAGVRSRKLRGCGHIPVWDDPEQVAQVLLEGSASPPGR
jgi:pimeloyl-ACP methyl ester carboxylesterase